MEHKTYVHFKYSVKPHKILRELHQANNILLHQLSQKTSIKVFHLHALKPPEGRGGREEKENWVFQCSLSNEI